MLKQKKARLVWSLGLLVLVATESAEAEVVGTLDEGGDVEITNQLGNFSSEEMQDLITATNDLEIAGVLDAEGAFAAGDFSQDDGALAQKLTGTARYGRSDGVASKASGERWGFVNGEEFWTPDPGLSHFGLITTPAANTALLTVTVTYSDATTDSVATPEAGITSWIGFHKPGETITAIVVSDAPGGAFGNWDDVALAFVESTAPERPEMTLNLSGDGEVQLTFTGVLQESPDLENWTDLEPAPTSPLVIPVDETRSFYRSRLEE